MRKVGLAAFDDLRKKKEQYQAVGDALIAENADQVRAQVTKLQILLTKFATEHGHQIRSEPRFRNEFARMCTAIGVDPLHYSVKNSGGSVWSSLFSKDVNDFYFGLAVRIIEKCRATRQDNGGILGMDQLLAMLNEGSVVQEISEDDVARAIDCLKDFGPGLHIERLPNGSKVIRSVPQELNKDQSQVLVACEALGYVTVGLLQDNFGWSRPRCQLLLDEMVALGMLWLDTQATPTQYWTP